MLSENITLSLHHVQRFLLVASRFLPAIVNNWISSKYKFHIVLKDIQCRTTTEIVSLFMRKE